jgi:Uma2 family endonuclease
MAREPITRWPEFELFVRDKPKEERWELIDGAAIMQASPNVPHQMLVGRLIIQLDAAARRKGDRCRAMPGVTIKIDAVDTYAPIPDVLVRCGPDTRDWSISDPRVIVEVMSPPTDHMDLGFKLGFYKRVASLRAYIVVDPEARNVHLWQRVEGGDWTKVVMSGSEGTLRVDCLDLDLSLADLHDRA